MSAVLEHELVLVNKPHGQLYILDQTGDTKKIWNPDNKDEVEDARNSFDFFKKKGYLIYRVGQNGKPGELMQKFDPEAEKLIAVPNVVGG